MSSSEVFGVTGTPVDTEENGSNTLETFRLKVRWVGTRKTDDAQKCSWAEINRAFHLYILRVIKGVICLQVNQGES